MTASIHRLSKNGRDDSGERIKIEEFAKRVHRKPKTIYKWISQNKLPANAVVNVYGHMEIDWSIAKQFIKPIN